MGVSDSKIIAQKVLIACEEAETQGRNKLDDASFWRDEVSALTSSSVYT